VKIVAYLYSDPLLESTPDRSVLTQHSELIWGKQVDQLYQDLAVSKATLKTKRTQLQQLLTDAQMEAVDFLLVRRLSELGDSITEVCDRLADLQRLGIQVIDTAQEFSTELTSLLSSDGGPATDVRGNLLQLLQTIQRQQHSRHIRQGHAHNRVKALPPPGKAPYGYRRGKDRYALDRAAATLVKDFFEQFLLYGSLRGAVRYLEKKHGKKISVSTGHRWLVNAVYRGDLEYHNGEIISDTHVPIISRDEAAQVDRLLRRNRRLPPRTASAPRSLAGLVICAHCQSAMTVTRVTAPHRDKDYLYLRPTACPQRPGCQALPYQQVLKQTIDTICRELPLAVSGTPLPDMELVKAGLQEAIAQKAAILTQFPALIRQGILDAETAELRAYKLRTDIAALHANLAQLPPVNLKALAQAVSIPRFWLDLSETERRFYFREFIRQIEIAREGEQWQCHLSFIFGGFSGKPTD
jgi:DNA invertase Pin-like site-specific DNA recombinase